MRALIQRVSSASVSIDGQMHSRIGKGLLIFLGIRTGDSEKECDYLAEKCASLRIFEDAQDKMNLSVKEVNGSVLVVSQFTLYADTRKGNRPSFVEAAPPQTAEPLYERFVVSMQEIIGKDKVSSGVFRAMMDVSLINDGPVTVIVESKN
jgi:D-tyrosyl-tRNA(Tyr) deacylase